MGAGFKGLFFWFVSWVLLILESVVHMGSEGGYRGVLLFGLLASLLSSFFLFFSSLLSLFSQCSFLAGRKTEGLCNDFAWSLLHEREGLVGSG